MCIHINVGGGGDITCKYFSGALRQVWTFQNVSTDDIKILGSTDNLSIFAVIRSFFHHTLSTCTYKVKAVNDGISWKGTIILEFSPMLL